MKRKRGKAKPKLRNAYSEGVNETTPRSVGLDTCYSVEDLLGERNITMDTELRQDEPSMNDYRAGLEQVVAKKRVKDKGNLVHNTNTAFLGNLSKFAASTPAKSSRGDGCAEYGSRMDDETSTEEARMSGQQTVPPKGRTAVNRTTGFFPDALREIVISVMSELSKDGGGLTAKQSSGFTSKPISNAPSFHTQGERTLQEVSANLNPQYRKQDLSKKYRKQELNASLSVIKKIMELDAAEPFSTPVDPIAFGTPDYYDVVHTPMDFGTICYYLENGYKYLNSGDVYKDVQHIWENCSRYYKTGDYILELMKQVKTSFMNYWTAAGLHIEHDLATAESTMMNSMHRKGSPVRHVPDQGGTSHVQMHQPSSSTRKRVYQPHLGSNKSKASLGPGNSHLQPREPNIRRRPRSMRRCDHPAVPLSDKTRPSKTQFYHPSAVNNQPQLSSNQLQSSQQHTQVNTNNEAWARGRIDHPPSGGTRGQHVQDLPYEPTGDELLRDGIAITRSHMHDADMIDEDTLRDDAIVTRGRDIIDRPSRGSASGHSNGRGTQVQDYVSPGDGMDNSESHSYDEDMVDEDISSDNAGEGIVEGRIGEERAPCQLKNLEQRIPFIIYKGLLVVPPQEDGIKLPCVNTGITNAIQTKFVVGKDGPTWTKVPAEIKEYYFREWNKHYKCSDDIPECQVKKIWFLMAGDQYRRMCFKARQQFRRSGHPSWCAEEEWKRFLSFYEDEKMKKKCEQASKNCNSDPLGLGKTKHAGGSRSFVYHELVMKQQNPDITEDEVFLRTHTKKGTDEFIDAKSKKIYEDYISLKNGPGFDPDAWVEATGGAAKNRVYGFGSLAKASSILGKTPTRAASFCGHSNKDFTQSKQFNEKVCEKVDQMRAEIHTELKTQLQSEHAEQMEKLKSDFELRLQEAIKSLTPSKRSRKRST